VLLPLAVRGIAAPFAIASTVTLTMGNLPPDRLKLASGLFTLMRNLAGRRHRHCRIRDRRQRQNQSAFPAYCHLNFSNTELAGWPHRMTSRYTEAWGDPTAGEAAALKRLWEAAYREAQVQAFADVYLVIGVCFVVSAMMVSLMRGVTSK
jgi:MFS transporter, DHA2 family, multidrug resistance protein